jgi:hypothetical protein
MPDDMNVTPLKPPPDEATSEAWLISPERRREINGLITDMLLAGMSAVADEKSASMEAELKSLRARVDRLERAYPREVEAPGK